MKTSTRLNKKTKERNRTSFARLTLDACQRKEGKQSWSKAHQQQPTSTRTTAKIHTYDPSSRARTATIQLHPRTRIYTIKSYPCRPRKHTGKHLRPATIIPRSHFVRTGKHHHSHTTHDFIVALGRSGREKQEHVAAKYFSLGFFVFVLVFCVW